MSVGAIFWLVIFGLATFCFFVVATVVTVKGASDLKDLLRERKD